jgi:hypothetical protein
MFERHYLELGEDLGNVCLAGEPDHDVQLLQLDVDGIVVLDEEDLHLVLEDVRPLLDDEVDVAQGHVLHLHGEIIDHQGVTKRSRLSWLTNSALVYEPKCGGGGLRSLSQ